MARDSLLDWRCKRAVLLTRTGPNTYSGDDIEGPKSVAVVVNPVEKKGKHRGTITHRDCFPVALSLDIAMKAATRARQAYDEIDFRNDSSSPPRRTGRFMTHETEDSFLEYAEQFMIAVTFSFQAIETFANDVIGMMMQDGVPFEVGTKEKPKALTAIALQEYYSTKDKILIALPRLLNVDPMPTSGKQCQDWDNFRKLQNLRDDITHLKWHQQYRSGDIDNRTLWYTVLNTDIERQPKAAAVVLSYFGKALGQQPQWLSHIIETYDLEPK
jgi:hypothetical protein